MYQRCKTQAEAKEVGRYWLKTLPKGWKLEVWENLGWHWRLEKGDLAVSPMDKTSKTNPHFSASIHEFNAGRGRVGSDCWKDAQYKTYPTPQQAVKRAVKLYREFLAGFETIHRDILSDVTKTMDAFQRAGIVSARNEKPKPKKALPGAGKTGRQGGGARDTARPAQAGRLQGQRHVGDNPR